MDKADASARMHIATTADLVGAVRLPEGSFRVRPAPASLTSCSSASALSRDRKQCVARLTEVATEDEGTIRINRHFEHPEMVRGTHARPGPYGEACLPAVVGPVWARRRRRGPAPSECV